MKDERRRNLPASVLARLLAKAKRTGDDYQTLLNAFLAERFLYRLSVSAVRQQFVLKGAMLLRVWFNQPYRATRDLDFLRRGDGSPDAIRRDIEVICSGEVEPDGAVFDGKTMHLEAIRPEDEYVGTRVKLVARCGSARFNFQIDVGLGDAAWPVPEVREYPTLLEFPAPTVLAYAPETVIAEKLEAMVVLGDRNSRIKDFFDIRHLAATFEFDGGKLAEAIRQTFERRHTTIPEDEPLGLTSAYWQNPSRPAQVRAFASRARLDVGPNVGDELLRVLRPFLLPVLSNVRQGVRTRGSWSPGGPWR